MARADNDSWDLASSVGATATMVAAARAMATRQPEPLINDPFADPLVRAVGIEFFTRLLDGEVPVVEPPVPQIAPSHAIDMLAVRTRFFDDFFVDASAAGIRQAVILASGLDSRAYRLPWPDGTVVFEIDQQAVIDFKTSTLSSLGALPGAQHRPVAVDLRADWPAALRANGFDDTKPTAWSAEGLLSYLPPDAQDRLFDEITALSAPGSRIGTEYNPDGAAAVVERNRVMAKQWKERGFDLDLAALMYTGERNAASDYLAAHGWQVSTETRDELLTEYGRELPTDDDTSAMRKILAVTAIRDGKHIHAKN